MPAAAAGQGLQSPLRCTKDRDMREFLERRLRRAPIVAPLWDEYERMRSARDAALQAQERALAERDAALNALIERDRIDDPAAENPYPLPLYQLWAYRLLLGREPEHPHAVNSSPETSRRDIVQRFINSDEFLFRKSIERVPLTPLHYMVELDGGMRFWLLSGDQYISPAIATGTYEPAETAFIRRHVRPGMAVVDIGANLGWFTFHLAHITGPTGRVDAFEPRADLFDLLTRSVAESKLANVRLHNCALAAANSTGQMIWSSRDVNPGGTFLAEADFADAGARSHSITVRTLDACIAHRVDFIKIDVEGAELLVFHGAERILSEDRPVILAEINRPNLERTSHCSVAQFGDFAARFRYRLHQITADGGCGEEIGQAYLNDIRSVVNVAMVPDNQTA